MIERARGRESYLPRDQGPSRSLVQRRPFEDYESPRHEIMGEKLDPDYLYLDVGSNPLGKPPNFEEVWRQMTEPRLVASGTYASDFSFPVSKLEKRFGVDLPFVGFGLQGAAGITHDILTKLISGRRFNVVGVGDAWPIAEDFVNIHGARSEFSTVKDINYHRFYLTPMSELNRTLEEFMFTYRTDQRRNMLIYLTNPDIRGDYANHELVRGLFDMVKRKGWYLVIDEVLADTLPDEESAIRSIFTDRIGRKKSKPQERVYVIRSGSKFDALEGEGVSYVVAAPRSGALLKRVEIPRAVRGSGSLTINSFFSLDHETHLIKIREKMADINPKWLKALERYGIKVLPTSDYTYLLVADGERNDFDQALLGHKILCVPLDKAYGSSRYVRFGLPMKVEDGKLVLIEDESGIDEAAQKIYYAKRAV